jgi:hypothetical protein
MPKKKKKTKVSVAPTESLKNVEEQAIVSENVAAIETVAEPVVEKPVVEEPVVEEPVAEPVVEESVVEEPVVEEPVVEEPVVVTEPVVVEEPVVEDQWVEKRWTRVNGSLKKVMYMNLNTNEHTKERQDNIVEIIYIGREEMNRIR